LHVVSCNGFPKLIILLFLNFLLRERARGMPEKERGASLFKSPSIFLNIEKNIMY
jgi:hypothetical protein